MSKTRYIRRMNSTQTVTLNNGVEMPRFGLGVYQSQAGSETASAVRAAIQAGYRSIDTAAFYENEQSVGEAIATSGTAREELFITTKVWNSNQGYDQTLRAFEDSMGKLNLEYLDLYLIHWPVEGAFLETWHALEELYRAKRVRAIGVSNFHAQHLTVLAHHSSITPQVNQVELHPYMQQQALREFCAARDIVVEAWSPIARGRAVKDPVLMEIGRAHGKSAVQVTLRWQLQAGIVTIPKSVHEERIIANADIFDFTLTDHEMHAIEALDRGNAGRIGPHPDAFDF